MGWTHSLQQLPADSTALSHLSQAGVNLRMPREPKLDKESVSYRVSFGQRYLSLGLRQGGQGCFEMEAMCPRSPVGLM